MYLHVAHNGFHKGMESYGLAISEFIIDVYYFFVQSAARWEDCQLVQEKLGLPKHKFVKHLDVRWLTLSQAIDRILVQWDGLLEYFLKTLPKQQPNVAKVPRYTRIKKHLDFNVVTLVQLHFLRSVAGIFTEFLAFFQREEPLIHLLYDWMCELVRKIMGRFVKRSAFHGKAGLNCTW